MVVLKTEIVTKFVLGYTTNEGLMVDLDKVELEKVKKIAESFCKSHRLKGYLILETSPNNYAIIWDKRMKWSTVLKILGKIFFYLKEENRYELAKWVMVQLIKKALTIRVSCKGKKDKPKILVQYGSCEGICKEYLSLLNDEFLSGSR